MGRSKLKTALKAEKGIDIKKLKEKRRLKERAKLKTKRTGSRGGANKIPEDDQDEEEDDEEDDDEDVEGGALVADNGSDAEEDDDDESADEEDAPAIDLAALDESSDDSSVDFEEKIERPKKPKQQPKANDTASAPKTSKKPAEDEDEDEEEEDEEDDEIDWTDLPEEEREDLVPRTRININNTTGLLASLKRFAIPTDDSTTFASHQSLASKEPTADVIGEDLMDDIKRELAFYAQALDAAKRGRALLKAEGVPFSRPTDYFAEMVKDDGHMEKVKAKLVEEASAKKASAEARKLRDLKKFGKQVQVAKLQERQKEKRETLEKIKTLKRKRSETGGGDLGTREADLFDVGVENELKSYNNNNNNNKGSSSQRGGPGMKRQKKNEKFGFGGKKKYSKSGDAESSGDLSGFSAKRMKGGAKGKTPKTARLGKSRRKAGAAKR
ncbi:eukaryotic rRNA processing protein EBP2-domain-containing protein [Xylaria bambusicola]|uniref:eukaryotic rRNA processing protein EBP2-domain-containing protein n=1 Tax=Xylaria bambusicola TaxID=326684 RepID=UPI0020087945|nr:eukaryotic rRNA processing protein EBP2-domain-containing protein [Xylaria bambusicola]KAI0514443.1 eukaryotic rRNA processing protein EBP2-domain-containing protein [Xylaria bambusicola]